MVTLRTPETESNYHKQKIVEKEQGICALCERKALTEFTHWKIVENLFPYDTIASTHHMLATKAHIPESEVSPEAWKEFRDIKKNVIAPNYSCIMENMPGTMTIPTHFHFQLVVLKN